MCWQCLWNKRKADFDLQQQIMHVCWGWWEWGQVLYGREIWSLVRWGIQEGQKIWDASPAVIIGQSLDIYRTFPVSPTRNSGHHQSFSLLLWILFFKVSHMSKIIQCLSFFLWLISLNISPQLSSMLFQMTGFPPFIWLHIFHCNINIHHIFFIHSSVNRHRLFSCLGYCKSVQLSSVTQSCLTLCDCMNCSTPGLPVHHQLLESTQTHVHWVSDAIQPSYPLSSPSLPALNLSQHNATIEMRVQTSFWNDNFISLGYPEVQLMTIW